MIKLCITNCIDIGRMILTLAVLSVILTISTTLVKMR